MPAREAKKFVSGWCNTGHHSQCPQEFLYSMGVWAKKVCRCDCHPATEAQDKRRGKEEIDGKSQGGEVR